MRAHLPLWLTLAFVSGFMAYAIIVMATGPY
jgi:hypothetical protein